MPAPAADRQTTEGNAAEPVTQASVATRLKQEGFTERVTRHDLGSHAPAAGFHTDDYGGGVLVCWIPATGQAPRDLDALARSYDMALKYAAAACKAGWAAERWGVIWHYALIKDSPSPVRDAELPPPEDQP